MPRKKRTIRKREVMPDPVYRSVLVSKFVNHLMLRGKKTKALNIFYKAMDYIRGKMPDKEPLEVFHKALENVMPVIETRPRRIGGATYQVPMEVPEDRRRSLAFRWIINYSRARKGRPMYQKLAMEIMDAYNNQGAAVKKKEDTHKMAEANRAFAHYRLGR